MEPLQVPQFNKDVAKLFKDKFGWDSFVVGGAPRDHIMGITPADFDIVIDAPWFELFDAARALGLNPHSTVGKPITVHSSNERKVVFDRAPVLMVHPKGEEMQEWTIPRIDVSTGPGKNDFVFETGPHVSMFDDSIRRDFTAGTILFDINTELFTDFHGATADIRAGVLDIVSEEHFPQSIDRVIRAFVFIARFGWEPSPLLIDVAWNMQEAMDSIPREQVGMLFRKAFAKGAHLHKAFQFLIECGWIDMFPELAVLMEVEQDKKWHPEGNVFIHTMMVLEQAKALSKFVDEDRRFAFMVAALCHDMGKVSTTFTDVDGRVRSPGHAKAGVKPARAFCKRVHLSKAETAFVVKLVEEHMFPATISGRRGIGRLAARLGDDVSIRTLGLFMEADARGVGGVMRHSGAERMVKMAEEVKMADAKPERLVEWRDIAPLGDVEPKRRGFLVRLAFSAQLAGEFSTTAEGVAWLVDMGHVEVFFHQGNSDVIHLVRPGDETRTVCGIEAWNQTAASDAWFSCKRCAKSDMGKALSEMDASDE